MPAIATLSINDGQATPVAHSFAVNTTDGSSARWLEKTAGQSLGYYPLAMSVRMAKTATAADVVEVTLSKPTLQTVNGISTVAYKSSASVKFNFSQQETDQGKKDLVAYVTNFLANATVKAAIPALDPFY
jgi:hypothetical protein